MTRDVQSPRDLLLPVVLGVEIPSLCQQLVLGRVVGVHENRTNDLLRHVSVVLPQVTYQVIHRTAFASATAEDQDLFGPT